MSLDVRCQDPGRGAGGAGAGETAVNDLDVGATRRELVGDGAAHDAGTDDGDVHIGSLVWTRQSVVGGR